MGIIEGIKGSLVLLLSLYSIGNLGYVGFCLEQLFDLLKQNVSEILFYVLVQCVHSACHELNSSGLILDADYLITLIDFLNFRSNVPHSFYIRVSIAF